MVRRDGAAPRVFNANPQRQLDQVPASAAYEAMRSAFMAWPQVIVRPSLRASPGSWGLSLRREDARGPDDAFLVGTEFAHIHALPDGGFHMALPEDVQRAVVDAGWGVPHHMAGLPSVSRATTLVFAPRNAMERAVALDLLRAAEAFARGSAA